MKIIKPKTAIAELKDACETAHEDGAASPFLFLIGAGVSAPAVPLAADIITDARKRIEKRGEATTPPGDSALDEYSHWLDAAYPQPRQRQRYLRKLIEGKNISQANLRLAHLLLNEDPEITPLPNLVVTTNFDNHLSRALRLFGKQHVVSDHPATSIRINPEDRRTLQVVHVHGSYEFYDLANLQGEITRAAESSEVNVATMAALLDSILRNRLPIVIGYSGWEGDVVMSALSRRLNGQGLPTNIYWFCYRREEIDRLPAFLRDHPHVRVVAPEGAVRLSAGSRLPGGTGTGGTGSGGFRAGRSGAGGFGTGGFSTSGVGTGGSGAGGFGTGGSGTGGVRASGEEARGAEKGAEASSTLPAQTVFEELIREFELPEPRFTREPLRFISDQLREVIPAEDLEDTGGTGYALGSVLEQIQRVSETPPGEPTDAAGDDVAEPLMEEIRGLLRRAQYREVIQKGVTLVDRELDARSREELIEMLHSSATSLLDNSPEELAAYEAVSKIGRSAGLSAETRRKVANAVCYQGITLSQLGREEEAIPVYDDLLERFGDAAEPPIQDQVAMTLLSKGIAFSRMGRNEEAIQVYDQLVDRFGDASETAIQERIAMALFNRGVELYDMGRREEAIIAYGKLSERFGDTRQPVIARQMAMALLNKGISLTELGRPEEALATYDQLVDRFGDFDEPAIQMQVAMALVNKGVALASSDRGEEAIDAYDQVLQRFGDADEIGVQEQAARALFNKAVSLGELDRAEEAIGEYDKLSKRYGDSVDPATTELVAMALVNKAATLARVDRWDESIVVYDRVLERFGNAQEPSIQRQVAMALLNKGVALGELDRKEDAIAAFDRLVERFGDAEDPAIQEQVQNARSNKGELLAADD